jgi:hypothetical protein
VSVLRMGCAEKEAQKYYNPELNKEGKNLFVLDSKELSPLKSKPMQTLDSLKYKAAIGQLLF